VSDLINCGICGDPVHYTDKHDCWTYNKIKSQENLLEICPICFYPISSPHWRCTDTEHNTHPIVG
jgi:hypothetical protein